MKKIFVSSTFKDMQAERDLVQEIVLPQLRNEAKKYGENIEMIDLRWGVDTSELESEVGMQKVMSVCLEEIDRSHPYMLIFLGERYGTMVPSEKMKEMIRSKNVSLSLEDYEISITALEIEYGALSQSGNLDNCIVCFREPLTDKISDWNERKNYESDGSDRKCKLDALKQRMMNELGDRVIFYTAEWVADKKKLVNFKTADGEALETKLNRTYTQMFQKDWEEVAKLSLEEKERLAVNAVIEKKLKCFQGREKFVEDFYKKITTEPGTQILQGCVGSGKTSVMCKIMDRLQQEGANVFCFIAGNTPNSGSAIQLLRQMVAFLERYLQVEDAYSKREDSIGITYKKWQERLELLVERLDEKDKCYFIIDAIDQLEQDSHVKKLDFILNSKKVKFVLSCTDLFDLSEVEIPGYQLEQLPLLMGQEIKQVIEGLLSSSSKNAYEQFIDAIMWKENADNPLYLSLVVQRLNMMNIDELYDTNSGEDIVQKGVEIVNSVPDDLEKAIMLLLKDAEQRVGADSDMLQRIIRLMAVSRNGLRVSDIESILTSIKKEFKYLEFARFRYYLDVFFVEREGGFFDFTHKSIRQGILNSMDNASYYHLCIARNMWKLPAEDEFRLRETLYHAYLSGDYDGTVPHYFSLSDNNQCKEIAKEEICKLVIMDQYGDWFINLMEKCENENNREWLFRFLSYYWAVGDYWHLRALNECRMKIYQYILQAEDVKQYEKDSCIDCMAAYYASVGDSQAIYYLDKALENRKMTYRKTNSENDYNSVVSMGLRYGRYLRTVGNDSQAIEVLQEFLVDEEKMSPENRVSIFFILGLCCKENSKGLQYTEKALEILEAEERQGCYKESVLNKSRMYQFLGVEYVQVRDFERAKKALEKCEEIFLPSLQQDKTIDVLDTMAYIQHTWYALYRGMEKYELAEEYVERALVYRKMVYEKTGNLNFLAELINDSISAAITYNAQKKHREGLNKYREALDVCEKLVEERGTIADHKLLTRILKGLCITHENLKEYELMRDYGEKWKVEAEFPLNVMRSQEVLLECATCYNVLHRAFWELGNKEMVLKYCDEAIKFYQELSAQDKAYEEKVSYMLERRESVEKGGMVEKRERTNNPIFESSFEEGGTVDKLQLLWVKWNTENLGICKVSMFLQNQEGEIIDKGDLVSPEKMGYSPYKISFTAPNQSGSYTMKTKWIDRYGNEYQKDFLFYVKEAEVPMVSQEAVRITSSLDEQEKLWLLPNQQNGILFKAEIMNSGLGIMEIRINVYDQQSNELICERGMETNRSNGSNPMTFTLYWTNQPGIYRFEVTVIDYWGRQTSRTFIKEIEEEKQKIHITSSLDYEQEIRRDTKLIFLSSLNLRYGIRKTTVEFFDKETGELLDKRCAENEEKLGFSPYKVSGTAKNALDKNPRLQYCIIKVTSEDVNGNEESKEWTVRVIYE